MNNLYRELAPISDAACKIASDMMVSAEYHAMPRRWATGMSRDDFADENGQPLGAMSSLAGRLWVNEGDTVTLGSDVTDPHRDENRERQQLQLPVDREWLGHNQTGGERSRHQAGQQDEIRSGPPCRDQLIESDRQQDRFRQSQRSRNRGSRQQRKPVVAAEPGANGGLPCADADADIQLVIDRHPGRW